MDSQGFYSQAGVIYVVWLDLLWRTWRGSIFLYFVVVVVALKDKFNILIHFGSSFALSSSGMILLSGGGLGYYGGRVAFNSRTSGFTCVVGTRG